VTEQALPLANRAIFLGWFTILYNLVEGAVSMGFGWSEESLALFGFGVDSWIEVASAAVVLWRLRGHAEIERERRAALVIGGLFVALAAATALGAVLQLAAGQHPDSTVPGVVVSLASLGVMAWLWQAKVRVAKAIGSRTLEMDAACSRACIQLSVVLLAGSVLYLLVPALWWVDAAAALGLAALILKEGVEGIREARKPTFTGGCCGHCD
jgi:divalent metal cation (Fe/Co/Zn/Cd) transporter